jgi:hypothetical protein
MSVVSKVIFKVFQVTEIFISNSIYLTYQGKRMVTTIRIDESDKERYDNLKRILSLAKKHDLTQEEITAELLDCYEQYKEVQL